MFFTIGIDGYLKLRSTMQKRALISMGHETSDGTERICIPQGLYAADWSKVRPLVFACAGDGGVVRVHDLGRTQPMVPIAQLKAKPTSVAAGIRSRILALQFNHKQRDFLACGDVTGCVHIWQLSWELSNAAPHENEMLHAYIDRLEQKSP